LAISSAAPCRSSWRTPPQGRRSCRRQSPTRKCVRPVFQSPFPPFTHTRTRNTARRLSCEPSRHEMNPI
jgi:hypothetical protein